MKNTNTKHSKNNAQSNTKSNKAITSCNVCKIQFQTTIFMANCFHIFCLKCGEHIVKSGNICPICNTKSSFRSIPFPGDVNMLGDMLSMPPDMIATVWAEYYMFLATQKKHAKEIAKVEEMSEQEANVGNNECVKSSSSQESSMTPEFPLNNNEASHVSSIHKIEPEQLEQDMVE